MPCYMNCDFSMPCYMNCAHVHFVRQFCLCNERTFKISPALHMYRSAVP